MATGRRPGGAVGRKPLWAAAGAMLLLPAVAMRVSDQVNWGAGDFAVFALMLGLLCGGVEAVARMTRSPARRTGAVAALVAAFVLVWAELAVGLFH